VIPIALFTFAEVKVCFSTKAIMSVRTKFDATKVGIHEGLLAAAATAVPTSLAWLHLYKNSPTFLKVTNVSSRTAILTMPPLFAFALASELGVASMADNQDVDENNTVETILWAERVVDKSLKVTNEHERRDRISDLYKMEVGKNLRIIPNPEHLKSGPGIVDYPLPLQYRVANFVSDNPFKVLVGIGLPAVGYVFSTEASKTHLQFQQMIMHTRVIGQFTVITCLLTLMGFKDYMDNNGRFVTEFDAACEVAEIAQAREKLLKNLKRKDTKALLEHQKVKTLENDNFTKDSRPLTVTEIMDRKHDEENAG